jgi:hypothetical protein
MKSNKLIIAILKALLGMACMFLIGYFGYHYPDAMIWVIAIAIFCAFSWYFYAKANEE